jgi:hypothetical protein
MKKSNFTEWMKEASPPEERTRERHDLPEDGEESRSLWERVYHPFVATMQEWIDLNA